MIDFICSNPECRTKLEVGEELAGKTVAPVILDSGVEVLGNRYVLLGGRPK